MKFLKLLALMATALVLGTGCGNVQKQLNTVLVFEQSAQGYVQKMTDTANAAANMLPPDQKADYLAKIDTISTGIVTAMSNKDDALQSAIAANSVAGLDFARLTQDVVSAVNALVTIVEVIGTEKQKAEVRAISVKLVARYTTAKAALAQ